jgi:effector-binding domain-containing protein
MMVLVAVVAVGTFGCKKKAEGGGEPAVGEPTKTAEPAAATPTVPAEPAKAEGPGAIVDKAIEAAGGLENLKAKLAAATWESEGTFFGQPYKATTYWKAPDRLVMVLDGGEMTMGYAGAECWSGYGEIVVDCPKDDKGYSAEMLSIVHVMNLYPLKEEGVQVEAAGEADVDGTPAVGVKVSGGALTTEVVLFFDKATGLLLRSTYEGHFAEQSGTIEHRYSEHRDFGGVTMPGASTMTLNGKQVMNERILSARLGEVDETKFARPAQAALGQDKVRSLPEQQVAVTTVTGPYEGLGPATGGLFGWVMQKGLVPMGAPTYVYLKDPTSAASPAEYVTEVSVPVVSMGEAPAAEGGYEVRTVPAMEIAWRLEQGAYDQVAARYADLAKWAAENGYEIAGSPGMTCFNDPQNTPPEQLLNLLYYPVRKKQ